MFELLVCNTSGKDAGGGGGVEPVEDIFFLIDPKTQKLTTGNGFTGKITLSNGAFYDTNNLLDGGGVLNMPNANSSFLLKFDKILNLAVTDWTLEWSVKNLTDPGPGNTYSTLVMERLYNLDIAQLIHNGSSSISAAARNQMVLGNTGGMPSYANLGITRAQSIGVHKRYAMSCKANKITVFVDGLLNMTYTFYATAYGDRLAQLFLGSYASGYPTIPCHIGAVKLSKGAKYTANYTPIPF